MKHQGLKSLPLMLAAAIAFASCSSESEAPTDQVERLDETAAEQPGESDGLEQPGAQTTPAALTPPETPGPKVPAASDAEPETVAKKATETPAATAVASVLSAPDSFRQCAVCHSAASNAKHKIGPNLWGVVGRAAATAEGYNYSSALAGSDLVWTLDNLDRYIEAPAQVVPGTKMVFPGQKDPAKRREIIDYLASLK